LKLSCALERVLLENSLREPDYIYCDFLSLFSWISEFIFALSLYLGIIGGFPKFSVLFFANNSVEVSFTEGWYP
jgi:hypothetical protein